MTVEPTARALLEHLRDERNRTVVLWQHIYGTAWATPEREARLAGYDQAIIDAEEWIAHQVEREMSGERR